MDTPIHTLYKWFEQATDVCTDSRQCKPGSLFFALKGERFDGNRYAETAVQTGCLLAVVDDDAVKKQLKEKALWVPNCLKALQLLAATHRQKLGTPVIGITGTNGKTTTKELVTAVLQQAHAVCSTQGNLNNHIGVPLTLLTLTPHHTVAVVEMGANHIGEIAELCSLARPDYGLITNIGKAHLGGFGSAEGVKRTKGELYDFIRANAKKGVFVNADDPVLMEMAKGLNTFCYGKEGDGCLVTGRATDRNDGLLCLTWRSKAGQHQVPISLTGTYNLPNLLAACAVGMQFGVPEEAICQGLKSYRPENLRSQIMQGKENKLVVDTYNANPSSMEVAINAFAGSTHPNKRLILGNMNELGAESEEEHQKVAQLLKHHGLLEQTFFVGMGFRQAAQGTIWFENTDELMKRLKENPIKGCSILIKGSRTVQLERVIPLL